MRYDLGDLESIASDIEDKTTEEVSNYMSVFTQRFRELKERDMVIMKFQKKDFEERNGKK